MSRPAEGVSIAVDTGGTFTDVVALVDGRLHVVKVPSTPADPSVAVLRGVRALLAAARLDDDHEDAPASTDTRRVAVLVHGSTVATNALLERRGADTALVTNAGFEDVLEIGRQNRPQLYALAGHRPPPLVPAARRFGIPGRLAAGGSEVDPLHDRDLAGLVERLAAADVQSIAICLLHSYANPAHERRVARALAGIGVPVSVSSALLPEHREYERTATTVVNAYVAPVMDGYLARLEASGIAERLRIMGSAGGVLPVRRARAEPVHTVLSGPAGGVIGAAAVGRRHGFGRILTFDMGGTSTDVSLVPDQPLHTREFTIGGTPVAVPVLDIHTVGAGGGSIARIDPGGALRVGPASAGAEPGPICYGRGGTDLTVTDANVWLGRLPIAGWQHRLDGPAAAPDTATGLDRDPIASPLERLAGELGTTPDAAAAGIIAVVDTAMEGALRVISVERGHDPADAVLVPFGGAAGLHAVELATRLGVPRILVPPAPGALSALGMLEAPVRRQATRTLFLSAAEEGDVALRPILDALHAEALAGMHDDGVDTAAVTLRATLDVRYRGQSYEFTVPADGWLAAFHAAHARRYGHARPGDTVEVVLARVEAVAAVTPPPPLALERAADSAPPLAAASENVWFDGAWHATPRFVRDRLLAGQTLDGAAIIGEYSATFWLPPGWTATVQHDAALLVTRTAAA